ncbi:MAG: hypothetical protein HY400_03915, partial [Elusimicrobia bacterium]|nr:hypothetical protein [Elusimicrobiota bacterium]
MAQTPEEGKKKIVIPPISKNPQVQLKGKPLVKTTLLERLKNLNRKDIMALASGLAILILAPLATHFMLKPSGDSGLKGGFGTREGSPFGGEGPYEGGYGGFAPGSPVGQAGEVITPLSARDPSSLVMSPGGPQQPTPQADVRDALGDALKASAAKASGSAGLPQPKPQLAGALRGLGALPGAGSGASAPLSGKDVLASAADVPGRAGPKSFAGPTALPGYAGVGQTSPSQGTKGALDELRAAAEKAAGRFPQQGAAAGLEEAAKESVRPGGEGSSGGGPSKGDSDKSPAGSSVKDSKSIGESLAFLKRKMRMEKLIAE